MAEDEEAESADGDSGEQADVKAKIAKMSGSRIQKRNKEKALAAQASAAAAAVVEENQAPPAAPVHSEAVAAVLAMPSAKPATPSQPKGGRPQAEGPRANPKPARAAAERKHEAEESTGTALVAVFVMGLLAGCLPGVVLLVQGLMENSSLPPGVPADSVALVYHRIHCEPGTASRWKCDLYAWDGTPSGSGDFVPSGDAAKVAHGADDWRKLAVHRQLVHDGWFSAGPKSERVLYVRGVAVSAIPPGRK